MTTDEQSAKQGRPWAVEFVFTDFVQADGSRKLLLEQGVPEVKVKRYRDEFGRETFAVKVRRPPGQAADRSKRGSKPKSPPRDKAQ